MRIPNRVLGGAAALALALLVSFSGCIGLEEEIELRADGTSRYVADLTMLEMAFQAVAGMGDSTIGSRLFAGDDSSGADSVRHREFVDAKDHHFVTEHHYASLDRLVAASARAAIRDTDSTGAPVPQRLPLPGIRLERLDARRVRLVRTMSPSGTPAGPDTVDERTRRMFADRYYVFRLRAPAIESASGPLSADRKSAEWRIPILDLDKEGAGSIEAVLVRGKGR